MFSEYEDFFLAKSEMSEHTLRSYRPKIDSFLKDFKIKTVKDLEKISPSTIRVYRDSMKIKNSSRNSWTRVLSSFYGFMYRNEYIKTNVFEKIDFLPEGKHIIKMPTREEMEVIINSCSNKVTALMISIMSRMALREGELAGIKIEDISSDGKLIIHGKGDKERIIKLPEDILKAISVHLKNKRTESEYLFSHDGHKITTTAVYLRVNRYVNTLGFDVIRTAATSHPHALRHRALTNAHAASRDPYYVKHLAGHSNLAIGEKYVHAESDLFDSMTEKA